MGGVEPPSESTLTETSPGADGHLRSLTCAQARHAHRLGSFIMHGALKALRTHVHHSSTLCPEPWSSPAERSLIKQREEQVRCCSLIYKLPVFKMSGASARYFCLHTPVETGTSPRIELGVMI